MTEPIMCEPLQDFENNVEPKNNNNSTLNLNIPMPEEEVAPSVLLAAKQHQSLDKPTSQKEEKEVEQQKQQDQQEPASSKFTVIKRDGREMPVVLEKITKRIKNISHGLEVNAETISKQVQAEMVDRMHVSKLDDVAAKTAASMMLNGGPDYGILAARLIMSNLHKETPSLFSEAILSVHLQKYPLTEEDRKGRITKGFYDAKFVRLVKKHAQVLDAAIKHDNDYQYDYFGINTLMKAYLNKIILSTNPNVTRVIERPQYMLMRVALFQNQDDIPQALRTYASLSAKEYIHASPTLVNAGKPLSQCSSCFLLTMSEDSIDGIYSTLRQCALISKNAGGIGLAIHNVRAKGSMIRTANGPSHGIVPMLKVFESTARYCDQGSTRKGAFAIYLEPWHADIEAFIKLRYNRGKEEMRTRDLYTALWIPDLFMERVERDEPWTLFCPDKAPGLHNVWGDEFKKLYEQYEAEGRGNVTMRASDLWKQILNAQIETGTPYVLFKDACNRKSNQQNLGTIHSSNLCVHGTTPLLTRHGVYPIEACENKQVEVWNGEEWSQVTVKHTSPHASMMKITFSDGVSLTCTEEHKFYIQDDDNEYVEVRAKDLKGGDKLIRFDLPDANTFVHGDDFPYAYTHGVFCGYGTYNSDGTPHISLYAADKSLLQNIVFRTTSGLDEDSGKINVQLPHDMPPKYLVPINSSLKSKLEWLSGLFYVDGCVMHNKSNNQIQIQSDKYEFLCDIRLMLHTLGVSVKITKDIDVKEAYYLVITSCDLEKLINLGWRRGDAYLSNFASPQRNARQFVKVSSITKNFTQGPTYCFTEPKRHMGVFNGYLTGQCTEIVEYTAPDEVAVCNLASVALPACVENVEATVPFAPTLRPSLQMPQDSTTTAPKFNHQKLYDVTYVAIRNLDRIIDLNYYPVPEAKRSNTRHRPVGLGVTGLADVFAMMRLPYESAEAQTLNREIFETMYFAALNASVDMAAIHGPYSTYAGSPMSQGKLQFDLWGVTPSSRWNWDALREQIKTHGVRNSLLMAPMPTATTAQIIGYNDCFEPFTRNVYMRSTQAGEFVVHNPHLVRDLKRRGLWSRDLMNQIVAHQGSLQNIEALKDHVDIKNLYKTVYEMSVKTLINMAADRGAFICQSQSFNVFVATPTVQIMHSILMYAWKKALKTGCYYLRSQSAVEAIQFSLDATLAKKVRQKQLGFVDESSMIQHRAMNNDEEPEQIGRAHV